MGTPPQADADEPVYVISVAARLVGLPGWVLRVLDQEGVVVPSRTESNRRLYSNNDITLLNRVRHLTEALGVNIAGVKVILEMERERGAAKDSAIAISTPTSTSLVPTVTARATPYRDLSDKPTSSPPSTES